MEGFQIRKKNENATVKSLQWKEEGLCCVRISDFRMVALSKIVSRARQETDVSLEK